ncbi:aldo/keto reductase [Micromonospora sp. NPDC048839]|uniref:aldo/keto reductase n=1 Tax=Micromonospora sp. NPDC048839 TaxID=3155641 RepID=UPI0033F4E9D0
MRTRTLGPYTVSAIGLGAMPMSMSHDGASTPEDRAIATIHAALDAGVTLIDTADVYAPSWDRLGHNERIVAKALKSHATNRDGIIVATKGGVVRSEGEQWSFNASIGYLRSAVERSLRALGTDVIDLYQWHVPDQSIPYEEGVANFKQLMDEGKIRAVGISNASVEQITIALDVLGDNGLASVQNEFSPKALGNDDTLALCAKIGTAFLPYQPLGGTDGSGRTVGESFPLFAAIGHDHGVSPQQVVLAWELARSQTVIPIPGARRPESITDSAKAADLELSQAELTKLTDSLTPAAPGQN